MSFDPNAIGNRIFTLRTNAELLPIFLKNCEL